MFGAATNTNKCCTATGGPVLASDRLAVEVIGDLEVPDDVLFFVETDAQVRLKPSHELRF